MTQDEFQSRSSVIGQMGADMAGLALELAGWADIRNEEQIGSIRVDAVATTTNIGDPITSIFEVTYGIDEDDRPGLIRTDNLKKIISDAYILRKQNSQGFPYIILTSHLPREGTSGIQWLQLALGDIVDAVLILPAVPELREMSSLSEMELREWFINHQRNVIDQLSQS